MGKAGEQWMVSAGSAPRGMTSGAPGTDALHWLDQARLHLRRRQIQQGIDLLDGREPLWAALKVPGRSGADVLLLLAQWVDVGYRNATFLRSMLDLLPPAERRHLDVGAYVRVRMAEAYLAFSLDDADGAIRTLDAILRLDGDLLDADLETLAHLWKGRAHRRRADYEKASEHIEAARELAASTEDAQILLAVIQVQQGWLTFQRGNVARALDIFDQAEAVLQSTDHAIALGNIESARGRIVRRRGDYARALHHFDRAVSFYEARQPHHPNLARAVTNLAFVKRLLALQLKRHIDSSASRRAFPGAPASVDRARLAPLHKQYQELYRSAIEQLERAKQICVLHDHHSGLAAALLNAGHLHLDVGQLDLAGREAEEAYGIAESTNSVVLKARVRILGGLIENAHVEELLGHPEDAPAHARTAKQHCIEAVALAQTTQNKRLLINAQLALGEVAANNFFRDYDLARRCADTAAALIEGGDADYVVDELNALRAKLLQSVGIDNTLREWSQGLVTGKTLQEVMEEFAALYVTQIWLREGRNISRVAKQLAMSPKKVRRLVRHAEKPA